METTAVAVVAAVVLGLVLLFVLKGKEASAAPAAPARPKPEGPFTLEQVAKHNTEEDAWIIIEGKVYDITSYVEEHPGGDAILRNAGGDSTAGFKGDQHPRTVWEVLPMYYIGDLKKPLKELEAQIAARLKSAGAVLTASAPGKWAGKEGKHVPLVEIHGGVATVTVPHGMDEDHFIELVWAKDQTGAVVAAAEFKPGAAVKAELKFALPTGATAITAYESCNLHGVWASAVFKC